MLEVDSLKIAVAAIAPRRKPPVCRSPSRCTGLSPCTTISLRENRGDYRETPSMSSLQNSARLASSARTAPCQTAGSTRQHEFASPICFWVSSAESSPPATRFASSGPIQKNGGVFNSRRKPSETTTLTPTPRIRDRAPSTASSMTAVEQKPSEESKRSQAGHKCEMALPYRGPTIGCAAIISTHSRTSCRRIGRWRMLMEAAYTLSANQFTALLEALFITPNYPYFHRFQVGKANRGCDASCRVDAWLG